jgi:hypothetical protein
MVKSPHRINTCFLVKLEKLKTKTIVDLFIVSNHNYLNYY